MNSPKYETQRSLPALSARARARRKSRVRTTSRTINRNGASFSLIYSQPAATLNRPRSKSLARSSLIVYSRYKNSWGTDGRLSMRKQTGTRDPERILVAAARETRSGGLRVWQRETEVAGPGQLQASNAGAVTGHVPNEVRGDAGERGGSKGKRGERARVCYFYHRRSPPGHAPEIISILMYVSPLISGRRGA